MAALTTVENQGILGLMPHEVNRRAARRFDQAAGSGGFRYTTWPTSRLLAQSYEERLASILEPDDLPLSTLNLDDPDQARLQTVWQEARPWRHDAFEEAVRSSPGGLRRGAFMSAIGRSLGLAGPLHDIREIFLAAAQSGYSGAKLEALHGVCRLMNDCYLYNLASEHQNDINFPEFDTWAQLVLGAPGAEPLEPARGHQWPTFEHAVNMPSPDAPMTLDPTELLAVRSDVYLDCDAALSEWQSSPGQNDEDHLRSALDAYAGAIRSRCRASTAQRMTVTYGSAAIRQGKLGVAALAAAASAAASALELEVESLTARVLALAGAGVAALIAVGESGYSLYPQVSTEGNYFDLPIKLRANPEASTPT
ncbi:hypothetical protein [Frankia gtarii]|uniref:hypothetical protein n=1 Tax=Frankia gtarii TaxID=2950102 RepID=UPI0021BFEB84|nr:hypothetical protein [Frankia gtarii]